MKRFLWLWCVIPMATFACDYSGITTEQGAILQSFLSCPVQSYGSPPHPISVELFHNSVDNNPSFVQFVNHPDNNSSITSNIANIHATCDLAAIGDNKRLCTGADKTSRICREWCYQYHDAIIDAARARINTTGDNVHNSLQSLINFASARTSDIRANALVDTKNQDINLNKFRHGNEQDGFTVFDDPFEQRSDRNITNRLIRLMLRVLPTLAVLLVVIGAYHFVTSTSADSTKSGAKVIGFAIGGLVLAYMSYIIVQFVLSVLFTNVV